MTTSLYVHIPFCISKCDYCSFSSWPGLDPLFDRYVKALMAELSQLALSHSFEPLHTLFFGGGTPTVLSAAQLEMVLSHCRDLFLPVTGAEISIEVNPGTVELQSLKSLRAAGFNRLSIGVQSLIPRELAAVGRVHSPAEAERAVRWAREAGFSNLSVDLMYGMPGQTAESWRATLDRALELAPDHMSLYQLMVEEGTPLAKRLENRECALPADHVLEAIDEIIVERCKRAGFEQYEISNYCLPGYRCRHNINYWLNNDYFGVGAGAVSCVDGVRQKRIARPELYCDRIESGLDSIVEQEALPLEESFRETVIMGLRMLQGVSRERLFNRYRIDLLEYYGPILDNLRAKHLVEIDGDALRITEKGRPYSNSILADLV